MWWDCMCMQHFGSRYTPNLGTGDHIDVKFKHTCKQKYPTSQIAAALPQNKTQAKLDELNKKIGGTKTLWATVFRCFHCGMRGHDLPKCQQCSQAYYCDRDCQRKHWRKHKPVCWAAVAALARHATRERLARAVREKDRNTVEGAEDDDLCVICQTTPVDPVQVSVGISSRGWQLGYM